MHASAWDDPARWDELKRPSSCPICLAGAPRDVLAEFGATWVTGGSRVPLPGYACVVSKHHVIEPFDLPAADLAAFWDDAMLAARVLSEVFKPPKLNYEIHGNTIPHLHLHLFPRFAGDPFVGGPIDFRQTTFTRTEADLKTLRDALLAASGGSQP